MPIPGSIQTANYTEVQWTDWDGILLPGQWSVVSDSVSNNVKLKIGDGVTAWNELGFFAQSFAEVMAVNNHYNGQWRSANEKGTIKNDGTISELRYYDADALVSSFIQVSASALGGSVIKDDNSIQSNLVLAIDSAGFTRTGENMYCEVGTFSGASVMRSTSLDDGSYAQVNASGGSGGKADMRYNAVTSDIINFSTVDVDGFHAGYHNSTNESKLDLTIVHAQLSHFDKIVLVAPVYEFTSATPDTYAYFNSLGHLVSGSTPSFGLVELSCTGAINGVNDTYVFTSPPAIVVVDGVIQKSGVDYSLASNTATFITAKIPQTGSSVWGFK